MCLENSDDDKRHSKVMKAMPAFFHYSSKGNISRSHSDYISLELLQQDL